MSIACTELDIRACCRLYSCPRLSRLFSTFLPVLDFLVCPWLPRLSLTFSPVLDFLACPQLSCLSLTKKTLDLCKVLFLEKSRKTVKNYHIFKNCNFGQLARAGVFCVAFTASKHFFLPILINNLTICQICHHKGGPLWFKTSQKLMTPLNRPTLFFLNRITNGSRIQIQYSIFKKLNQNFMKIRISLAYSREQPSLF